MKPIIANEVCRITSLSIRRLKNKFYIKYYMMKAGNDSPKLKKEIDQILIKLEGLLK